MIAISISEASLHFLDLVDRVRARDEEAVLCDNGEPVARLVPVGGRTVTGGRLAAAWSGIVHLDRDAAAAFEADVQAARGDLAPPAVKWD